MDITEIIKNALIFPSKNLETLSIYAIFTLLAAAFTFQGIVTLILGIFDLKNLIIGGVYIAIAIIIGFITRGISIECIKTGIDLEEKFPDFKWWSSLTTGVNKIVITVFYFLIPALIAVFIALITNVVGNILNVFDAIVLHASTLFIGTYENAVSIASFQLFVSLAITISAALIIFLIFSFFQAMAEARYAHTGSLKKALNLIGSIRDISRIGVGKLVILSVLIFVIVTFIEGILALVFDHLFVLSILTIVITPYLALFAQRALGLLYSDIV